MYSSDQVVRGTRRGLENPAYFGRELNRLYHRRLYRRDFNTSGIDVQAEEWDNLIILDACRFDDFASLNDLPGELESRESRGSHTIEFLQGNFAGRDLLDTVYVTASPQFSSKGFDADFHAVENVWDGEYWEEEAGTVRPETMADRGIAAAERYPKKRLILHFIQPHYPFLEDEWTFDSSIKDSESQDIWGELMAGELRVSPDEVRAAYRQNLRLAVPPVRRLLDVLRGLTVVTSDHGNMFGERARPVPVREWGHPPGLYTEQLVKVPWLVYGSDRREIVAESADDAVEPGSDPDERLRHLGYVE